MECLLVLLSSRCMVFFSSLLGKPRNDVLRLLRDFVLDSTVIGGLLSITQGAGIATAGVAAAAGALSAGFRYLISERSQRKIQPSSLLIEGIRRVSLEAEAMHRHLQSISMRDLAIPVEWQHLAQPNVPKSRSEKAT
jgi:hypothetical protein